jgi:PiT family inorganic phosphate transporter
MTLPLILSAAVTAPTTVPASGSLMVVVLLIVFAALVFDFLNGFHDAANSIATIVSTRVLSPSQAVIWAAFFNFVAAFVFGTKVSETISSGLVDPGVVDIWVVFAALAGAIIWNIITWLLGLPTSSSHALVAGIAGAAITKAGTGVLILPGKWRGIILFIFLGPIIGFMMGTLFMVATAWIFRRATPNKVDTAFRRMQLFSAAIFSLAHGGNDAQKTMGIIVMLLAAAGHKSWTQSPPGPATSRSAWARCSADGEL